MIYGIKRVRFKILIGITILTVITAILQYISIADVLDTPTPALRSKCDVVHVGIICTGSKYNIVELQTTLKSIYFFRNIPLHFHIMVDEASENTLRTLFQTWDVAQVDVSFYNTINFASSMTTKPHTAKFYKMLILKFTQIVPVTVTEKMIVIDPDLLFVGNIHNMWNLFDNFNVKQVIGIVEDKSNSYLKKSMLPSRSLAAKKTARYIMMYDLKRLKSVDWNQIFNELVRNISLSFPQDELYILEKVLETTSDLVYSVSCKWSAQSSYVCVSNEKHTQHGFSELNDNEHYTDYYATMYNMFLNYNGSLLRRQLDECRINHNNYMTKSILDECSDFRELQTHKFRTLLYFRQFKHQVTKNDVTLVSQLAYDRFRNVEELSNRWNGPMSLSVYLADSELQECLEFVENSTILRRRSDIAYHAVFKDGKYYPINNLRNVAMRNVRTPYMFLTDIDFIPMKGSYSVLKKYLGEITNMNKKALVVPAFETTETFPFTKSELLNIFNKTLFQFHYKYYNSGHGPINYKKWRRVKEPYMVKWKKDFEPYVVVQRNVTEYDERFFGFGWDKVSHITELHAQNYEFIVLPNIFIVHKDHPKSADRKAFLRVPRYRDCLKKRQKEFVEHLHSKYYSPNSSTKFL